MLTIQKYWELPIYGKTYYLSPYLIFNGIGLIVGLLLLEKKLKNTFKKGYDRIYSMYVLSIIAGWLGAHICDALFKSQAFSHAGFTFLGGLIFGSAFFIVSFIKFNGRENVMTALNAGVMPLVLGQATGRIGCYFSGCCYGKLIAHSNLLSSFFARHPTQIYESLFLFILFAFFSLKDKLRICIADIYLYLMFYGTFRFFIEFLRGDYRGHYLYGLSPSQWLSLVIIMGMSIFLTTKSGRKLFITK